MTGMTEEQRVTSAVEQILGGEREEDERILTRRLTSFIAEFRRQDPTKAQVKEVRNLMTQVETEILHNRRKHLEPLLNQLPADSHDRGVLSLAQIVDSTIERTFLDLSLSEKVFECFGTCSCLVIMN